MKTCRKCKTAKPLSSFYETKRIADGYMRECAECCKQHTKEWRLKNPELNRAIMLRSWLKNPELRNSRRRKRRDEIKDTPSFKLKTRSDELRHNYGLSLSDYDFIAKSQDGCCAICGTHESELKKPLFVDHDHKTKQVRGLLCAACNSGLGYFRDNPKLLEKAIVYIYEHITRKN